MTDFLVGEGIASARGRIRVIRTGGTGQTGMMAHAGSLRLPGGWPSRLMGEVHHGP